MKAFWHIMAVVVPLLVGCSSESTTPKTAPRAADAGRSLPRGAPADANRQVDDFGLPLVITIDAPEPPKEIAAPSPPLPKTAPKAPSKSWWFIPSSPK